jgi:flavin reductase (DIM6/NTAB) family NADH-FMN oxidoreductase RutF
MTQNVAQSTETSLADGFRQAMRQLVATVTIITSGDTETRAGMVATAVMSVSADPPSLAIGVNRDTSVWQAIQSSRRFGVNLLSTQHAGLVYPFSGQLQGEDRFTLGTWQRHATHTPFLVDAVVTLLCRVEGELTYGTHTLFVGAVEEVRMNEKAAEPLLWRDGGFANAVPLDELLT